MSNWEQAQKHEVAFHGDCTNSYNEETKQYVYATKMGLDIYRVDDGGRIGWDFGQARVIDVGGGPYSLLLKAKAKERTVVDPGDFPGWVYHRYKETGIDFLNHKAEDIPQTAEFDIAIMYNCLQHTQDPEKICRIIKNIARHVYVFEWVEEKTDHMHLYTLTEDKLNKWFGQLGEVSRLDQNPLFGTAYHAHFTYQ